MELIICSSQTNIFLMATGVALLMEKNKHRNCFFVSGAFQWLMINLTNTAQAYFSIYKHLLWSHSTPLRVWRAGNYCCRSRSSGRAWEVFQDIAKLLINQSCSSFAKLPSWSGRSTEFPSILILRLFSCPTLNYAHQFHLKIFSCSSSGGTINEMQKRSDPKHRS